MSRSVYVIINEWTDNAGNTSAELVGANFFWTETEAWESLAVIAEAYDVTIAPDVTSVTFEDHLPHIQFEEYYIQELTQL